MDWAKPTCVCLAHFWEEISHSLLTIFPTGFYSTSESMFFSHKTLKKKKKLVSYNNGGRERERESKKDV